MNCCDDESKQGAQPTGLKGLVTGPRRWWVFAAVAAVTVTAGLTLGWEQLVLFGIAPILISLLPCLVMCGLGLCMMKCKDKGAKSADKTAVAEQPEERPATAVQSISKEGA